MFKPVSGTWPDEASTKYAASAACNYYKAGANCASNMPYPPTSSIQDMIDKWFLVWFDLFILIMSKLHIYLIWWKF